jgi:hypothetical protein
VTEVDARDIALLDLEEAWRRREEIASPDHAVKIGRGFIDHRRRGLGSSSPIDVPPAPSIAMSEQIAIFARKAALQVAREGLPEDARAFTLWLVGHPDQGPGFLQCFLKDHLPHDAKTFDSIASVEDTVVRLRQLLDQRDAQTFGAELDGIEPERQRVIRSILEQARLSMADSDGETARHKFSVARRYIEVFRAQPKNRIY